MTSRDEPAREEVATRERMGFPCKLSRRRRFAGRNLANASRRHGASLAPLSQEIARLAKMAWLADPDPIGQKAFETPPARDRRRPSTKQKSRLTMDIQARV